MIFLLCLLLLGMAYINYKIFNDYKNFSTIFCIVWAILFIILTIFKDMFFSLNNFVIVIVLSGAISISVGGIIIKFLFRKNISREKKVISLNKGILKTCSAVMVILLPFYLLKCIKIYKSTKYLNIFYSMRLRMVKSTENPLGSFWSNVIIISVAFALICFNEYLKNREYKRIAQLTVAVSLIYNLFSGSSSMLVFLSLSLIGCYLVRNERIKIKKVSTYFMLALSGFLFISYMLNKSAINNKKGLINNVGNLFSNLIDYLVGPIIGFSQALVSPRTYIPKNEMWRSILIIIKKIFSNNIKIPSMHFPFISIGEGKVTNVYTIFGYYYFDLSIVGMIVFLILLSIVINFVYIKALRKSDICVIFYGLFFASICLSIFAEYFMREVIIFFKIGVVLFIFYNSIRFRKVSGGS